ALDYRERPIHSPVPALSCRPAPPPSAKIAWWSAASDRDREDLARWCRTVGPAVFHASIGAQSHRDTLVVVSWNAHRGSASDPRFSAGEARVRIRSPRAASLP